MSSTKVKDTPENPVMLEDVEKDVYSINSGDEASNKGNTSFLAQQHYLVAHMCLL